MTEPRDRFLPGVPGNDIERILNAAPGNEIARGKFDSPKSSAALAANAFGFFLHRAQELPPLPDCPDVVWPARSLSLEATGPCGRGDGALFALIQALGATPSPIEPRAVYYPQHRHPAE